ncbi:unnamed protein product [Ectocarpus sp. 13 AM-2016]
MNERAPPPEDGLACFEGKADAFVDAASRPPTPPPPPLPPPSTFALLWDAADPAAVAAPGCTGLFPLPDEAFLPSFPLSASHEEPTRSIVPARLVLLSPLDPATPDVRAVFVTPLADGPDVPP